MKKKILAVLLVLIAVPIIIYYAFPGVMLQALRKIERGNAQLVQKKITAAEHEIVYTEGGEGAHVLLVHGYGGDKDNWTRFARFITGEYHVIIPDLPGFGESSKISTESYDYESQVVRLKKFCDSLELKKFHIAGNSMGGHIATRFTALYPEMVLSLIQFNTAGIREPQMSFVHKEFEKGNNPLVVNSADDYDRLINLIFHKPPFIPYPIKKYFAERAAAAKPFNDKVMRDMDRKKVYLEELLGRIKAPVLTIWGDKDRVIDISCVDVLKKGLKNSKTVIMKDCGHLPMIERPEEAARHFKDFIKGL